MYKLTMNGCGHYNTQKFAFSTWKGATDFMYEALRNNIDEDGIEITIRQADYDEEVVLGYIPSEFVPTDCESGKPWE